MQNPGTQFGRRRSVFRYLRLMYRFPSNGVMPRNPTGPSAITCPLGGGVIGIAGVDRLRTASSLFNCLGGSLEAVCAHSTVSMVKMVTHRHVAATDTGGQAVRRQRQRGLELPYYQFQDP